MAEPTKTIEERMSALEDATGTILDMLEGLTKKVTEVDKATVKKTKGLFGGKRTKTAIKDTKTGTIYPSKARMGKELAGKDDFKDLDPGNNFVYYQIIGKAPDRFVDASDEEAEKVWEAEKARIAKEVEEANKRLQAEQKVKDEAEAKAAKEAAEAEAKAKK